MAKQSAFLYDGAGAYAYQDPDEDLDWTFNFNDPTKGPVLESGEVINGLVGAIGISRLDGLPITTEQLHSQTVATTYVAVFVRNLVEGVDYKLECTVETNSTPPRRYSDDFRLKCRE